LLETGRYFDIALVASLPQYPLHDTPARKARRASPTSGKRRIKLFFIMLHYPERERDRAPLPTANAIENSIDTA
jgi:hypothetical protein